LAHLARINSRQWRQYESDCNRENAIVTGMRYLRVFDRESVTTYAQAAELLGVSRQRVYQFVSLVTKLPAEVHDVLLSNEDRALARHFTERRLRPLARLDSNEDELAAFEAMLGELYDRAEARNGTALAHHVTASPKTDQASH